MAKHNVCLALIILSAILYGTIHIIMGIAHSFSFIHQISCQLIAFLCKDKRPAYPLMRQGLVSCALRFIIKDQCPALFLSHSHHQGPMSCSTTSYSLRQPPSFVICDISVSGSAIVSIPSPSDKNMLFYCAYSSAI